MSSVHGPRVYDLHAYVHVFACVWMHTCGGYMTVDVETTVEIRNQPRSPSTLLTEAGSLGQTQRSQRQPVCSPPAQGLPVPAWNTGGLNTPSICVGSWGLEGKHSSC